MKNDTIDSRALKLYGKKSIPQLIKIATFHFNAWIRARDSKDGWFKCIACGQIKDNEYLHASHYMASTYSATRFDPDNVHAGCSACNTHLHGNLVWFRQRLVTKIGVQKVELLEVKAKMVHKWDRTGLIYIIEQYKSKLKELKNAA